MLRRLALLLFLSISAAHAGPVDDARLAYIRGEHAEAMKVLIPAAEAGDPNAQNILGAAHADGNGVKQDYAKAVEWYAKSAAQGFGKALLNLGLVYAQGRPGIEPDYPKARDLLRKAAAKGIATVIWSYPRGEALDKDGETAIDIAAYAAAEPHASVVQGRRRSMDGVDLHGMSFRQQPPRWLQHDDV